MREKWKLDTIENEDLLSFPTLLLSTKSWITKWWTRKSKKRFWIICQLNLYSSKSTRARLKCNQRRKSLESCQKSFPRATTVKRFQNVSTVPIFVHRPTSQTTKNHKLATPKLEEEKTLWNWKSRSSEGSLGTWPSTAFERRTIERIWRTSRNLWSSRCKCWSSYHSSQTLCDGSMHRVRVRCLTKGAKRKPSIPTIFYVSRVSKLYITLVLFSTKQIEKVFQKTSYWCLIRISRWQVPLFCDVLVTLSYWKTSWLWLNRASGQTLTQVQGFIEPDLSTLEEITPLRSLTS